MTDDDGWRRSERWICHWRPGNRHHLDLVALLRSRHPETPMPVVFGQPYVPPLLTFRVRSEHDPAEEAVDVEATAPGHAAELYVEHACGGDKVNYGTNPHKLIVTLPDGAERRLEVHIDFSPSFTAYEEA